MVHNHKGWFSGTEFSEKKKTTGWTCSGLEESQDKIWPVL